MSTINAISLIVLVVVIIIFVAVRRYLKRRMRDIDGVVGIVSPKSEEDGGEPDGPDSK